MATSKWILLVAIVVAAALAGGADAQTRPCYVKNCSTCSLRNPYVCTATGCKTGYKRTASGGCNYCAVNYEQNLEARSFECSKCPAGTTSPGGTGQASQCVRVTVSTGRRLFADADEDLWA